MLKYHHLRDSLILSSHYPPKQFNKERRHTDHHHIPPHFQPHLSMQPNLKGCSILRSLPQQTSMNVKKLLFSKHFIFCIKFYIVIMINTQMLISLHIQGLLYCVQSNNWFCNNDSSTTLVAMSPYQILQSLVWNKDHRKML